MLIPWGAILPSSRIDQVGDPGCDSEGRGRSPECKSEARQLPLRSGANLPPAARISRGQSAAGSAPAVSFSMCKDNMKYHIYIDGTSLLLIEPRLGFHPNMNLTYNMLSL